MSVSFQGTAELVVSFEEGTSVVAGAPVMLEANQKVTAAAADALFVGVALHSRCGVTAVQLKGYVELPYSGAAPALGFATLAADGAGGVKSLSAGLRVLVISVDTVAQTIALYL